MKCRFALVSLLILAACHESEPDTTYVIEPPVSMHLTPDSIEIRVQETMPLSWYVVNSNNQGTSLVSHDTSVAKVSSSGVVSGLAVGSTYVVATGTFDLTVKDSTKVIVTR